MVVPITSINIRYIENIKRHCKSTKVVNAGNKYFDKNFLCGKRMLMSGKFPGSQGMFDFESLRQPCYIL